ncbi:MAG: S24/S26 family peptidase [Lachnospiraceae bacterium]
MTGEKRLILPNEELFDAMEELLQENYQVAFTVTGNSMWPLLCHGRDSAVMEKCSPDTLRKGDIVLFHATKDQYLFHRITSLTPELFETTGDGNCFRDGYFRRDAVIARAVKVIRKENVFELTSFRWKALARIWMALYPVRGILIRGWKYIKRNR